MTPHNKTPELVRREMVRRIWAGETIKAIATALAVAESTVHHHRRKALDQARAEGRSLPLCRCGQTAGHRGYCGGKGKARDQPKAERAEEATGKALAPPFSTYPPGHIFSLFYTPGA